MDITVWIIIGNIGIILVLLYLIRLSVFGGRDGSDKKSSKRTSSSSSLRKKQDELPSEKDGFSTGVGESILQTLEDHTSENETCRTDTSLRQRIVRLSKKPTTEPVTITGDPQNEEFRLIQEELIKATLVDEVEQSVNEELGGGITEKANFAARVESNAAAESSGLKINNLFPSLGSRESYEAESLLPSSQLCKLNLQTSQGCLCVSEQLSTSSVSGLGLDSKTSSSCSSVGNLSNELVHSLIPDSFSSCYSNTSTVNNSSPISELSSVAESLSEDLLRRASSDALTTVKFLFSVNEVADDLTNAIIRDVFHQIGGSIQREHALQKLSRFAETFTSSVVQEAVGEIIDEENKEQFVNNLANDILNGGLQEVVAVVNTNRQEKSKLYEYGEFSEQYSNKILADGIRLAAVHKHNSSVQESLVENSVKEGMQIASAAHQHAENLTSTVCKSAFDEASLSTALKPHIRGVVQNLVNEAIYEAVLRVGAVDEPTCKSSTEDYASNVVCSTALESHVEDTIQELISSAIDAVKSDEDQVSITDEELTDDRLKKAEEQVGLIVNGTVLYSAGCNDRMAGEKVQESTLQTCNLSDVTEKENNNMNGHMNYLEHSIEADQLVPDIVASVEQIPEDVVPDKSRHSDDAGSLGVQMRKKENSPTGFWRRSLIEDLENDMDLDGSFTSSSEKSELESPKFDLDSPTLFSNETALRASDEFSDEEFLDSSEDEIIDHAEEAKMGAIGGSSQPVASDDDDEDDDYFSDSDEDEGFEPFEAYLTVDGLCMSVPKDKHNYKVKSKHTSGKHKPKPRHRIKSADQHFNRAVIIDNGCGVLKAGFAGERKPRVVEPAVIGIPKRYSLQMAGMNGKKNRKYGSAATNAAGVLHLDYPMKSGMIDSWTDIEDLWEFMLYSMMGVSEGDHPVVLTEVANNPVRNREKIAEILFEHLSVPAMYLADQLSLALYASGMTTGVSVSSGFSVTEAAVVYEGHTLPYTAQQLDIAGQQLTENLRLLLRDNKGLKFVSSSEWQLVNTMKERLAYVAQDYSEEFDKYQTGTTDPKYFTLPDGQMVEISSELISSVEPLFEPESLVSANDTVASQLPLPKMVTEAINRCDVDLQDICCRSVVLSGGTTMLPGIVPRLQREVQELNPKVRKIRAPDERSIASWVGGSILASLSTFENQYITIDEYADSGPSIVRRKCF